MVGEALKGGRLAAEVLSREGFPVVPPPGPCTPWSFITAGEAVNIKSIPLSSLEYGNYARNRYARRFFVS